MIHPGFAPTRREEFDFHGSLTLNGSGLTHRIAGRLLKVTPYRTAMYSFTDDAWHGPFPLIPDWSGRFSVPLDVVLEFSPGDEGVLRLDDGRSFGVVIESIDVLSGPWKAEIEFACWPAEDEDPAAGLDRALSLLPG